MLSHVWLFGTPWTVAPQAPLSMGILQARILEWVAIPFSRGTSQPRDRTQVSCIAGKFFTICATRVWTRTQLPVWCSRITHWRRCWSSTRRAHLVQHCTGPYLGAKIRLIKTGTWWLAVKVLLPNREPDSADILGELLGIRCKERELGKLSKTNQLKVGFCPILGKQNLGVELIHWQWLDFSVVCVSTGCGLLYTHGACFGITSSRCLCWVSAVPASGL